MLLEVFGGDLTIRKPCIHQAVPICYDLPDKSLRNPIQRIDIRFELSKPVLHASRQRERQMCQPTSIFLHPVMLVTIWYFRLPRARDS